MFDVLQAARPGCVSRRYFDSGCEFAEMNPHTGQLVEQDVYTQATHKET